MTEPTTFHHGRYQLSCSVRVLANGRFLPELVITRDAWPSRPRSIAMEKGDFAVEYEAIEAARLWGIEWIANYG
ncbi:MAG: hypothetical protein V4505_22820 [Pseudomonadota bacterium]|jgi:hypothetical protein